jgi:hypothetical protein
MPDLWRRWEEVMSKHTPGPWKIEHDYKPYVINAGAGHTICAITGTAAIRPEAEANARLIAAAPEMLEALKLVRESGLADEYGASAVEDAINAAIKKATGQ